MGFIAAMRAIDVKDGKGPISSLFMSSDILRPAPKAGEALIKIKCFGLNRMDLSQRSGNYPVPPQAGKILGVEFSGTIVEVHDVKGEEDDFVIGDEVFGLTYGGAYAEFVSVSTKMLIHKPKEISWEVAAGIPETWITAIQAMHFVASFAPGKSILWHAGASSVSIAGIQLSKAHGASAIYTTVGSSSKVEFCKDLGATWAWNYKEENWSEKLLEVTGGKGVDIIVDFIGQSFFNQNLNSIALDGKIVIMGLLSGSKVPDGLDLQVFVKKRIAIEGSRLRSRGTDYQMKLRDKLVQMALPKFVDGTFQIPVEKVFNWKNIQEAHALMESNMTKGKIICTVE